MSIKNTDFLKNNPVFWSRLGFCYDPPIKNEEGKPLVFCEDLDKYMRFHKDFIKAGVKIHTCILHSGWVGIDEYDYSLTDRVLEEVFSENDDIYYIPRIKLNPPVDWCIENPEELFVYYEGPREKEEIRKLAGTLKHDYLGYEAPDGYYCSNDFKDTRPNVGGLISLQSFSSKKWLADAGAALEKLIDRLEKSKYADRIIGYHIAYGACGETVLWGRASYHYGDYGITNRREFIKWGIEKYGSQKNLEDAWNQKNITTETINIPSPEERYGKTDDFLSFVRARKEDTISTDFDIFTSEKNADALLYFAKIAKKTKKLVGSFYGYFVHIDNAAYTGHLEMQRLLDSPYIDFFAAPKSYYRNDIKSPGGELCCAQSVNLKKLWVDELDNRTYLSEERIDGQYSKDFEETQGVMRREFAKNLSHDSGFWWMDLGGGWYDSPKLMEEIQNLVKLNDDLRKKEHKSISDVLIVVDEKSGFYMRANRHLRRGFMEDFSYEAKMAGVLCDMYRMSDLENMDLSQYKLIVFAYCEYMEYKSYLKVLSKINPDAVIMFNYAVGIYDENGFDITNFEKITGCEIEPDANPSNYDFPQIKIKKQNNYDKQKILNVKPFMKRDEIRKIAQAANCHIYTNHDNAVLYGDNRFLALVSDSKDKITLKFSEKGSFYNPFNLKEYNDTDCITLDMAESNSAFLIKK